MRIIRYEALGEPRYGILQGSEIMSLDGGLSDPRPGEVVGRAEEVQLLAPCEPSTVICAAANYAGQIAQKGMDTPTRPGFFLKALNAVTGTGAPIYRPPDLRRLEYEGELAVVIGRTARDVPAAAFADYVLGYTCANDVTAHDYRSDGQWYRAKSTDSFCPLGPWIETEIDDPCGLRLRTSVNGEVVQDGLTSDMVFAVPELLSWVTRWITLQPGDVLLTGSPADVGPLSAGDRVDVSIEEIGTLSNVVTSMRP